MPKTEKDREVLAKYQLCDKEFQPILKQIYDINIANEGTDKHFPINVEPSKIVCLRLAKGGGKKYAYIKPITKEYTLLTEARYFMVICNETFNFLPPERQKFVILHEYCHCWFDVEKQQYSTIDHDVQEFSFLLKDPNWNTELVKSFKYEQATMFQETLK